MIASHDNRLPPAETHRPACTGRSPGYRRLPACITFHAIADGNKRIKVAAFQPWRDQSFAFNLSRFQNETSCLAHRFAIWDSVPHCADSLNCSALPTSKSDGWPLTLHVLRRISVYGWASLRLHPGHAARHRPPVHELPELDIAPPRRLRSVHWRASRARLYGQCAKRLTAGGRIRDGYYIAARIDSCCSMQTG